MAAWVESEIARPKSPLLFDVNWNSLIIWLSFYFFPITQFLFIITNAFLPLKISLTHSIHQGLIVSGMIKIFMIPFIVLLDYKQIITLTMIFDWQKHWIMVVCFDKSPVTFCFDFWKSNMEVWSSKLMFIFGKVDYKAVSLTTKNEIIHVMLLYWNDKPNSWVY